MEDRHPYMIDELQDLRRRVLDATEADLKREGNPGGALLVASVLLEAAGWLGAPGGSLPPNGSAMRASIEGRWTYVQGLALEDLEGMPLKLALSLSHEVLTLVRSTTNLW